MANNVSRIIIIDDSTTECLFMSHILQQAGYRVSAVMNGREGLQRVMVEHPQCLILDVVLPEMNGYEVCRNLRTQPAFKQLPILMVSTKSTTLDTNWAMRQGASRYLPKPFRQEAFLKTVQELLQNQNQPATTFAPKPPPTLSPSEKLRAFKPLLQTLIPLRVLDRDIQPHSPRPVIIADRLARRVYNMIDGRSNIEHLCQLSRIPITQMRSILYLLVEQRLVQLYTPQGQKVDGLLFLMEP